MTNTTEARRFYKGSANFMTPDAVAYKTTPNYYVELAKGWVFDSVMWGVTVREKAESIAEAEDPDNLSRSFFNEQQAREYYRNIW